MLSIFFFFFLSIAASASELSVKVIDPSSAAVSGAHVSLIRSSDSKVLRTAVTSAEGTAQIALPDSGSFQVRVLAPGFAAETLDVSTQARSHRQAASRTRCRNRGGNRDAHARARAKRPVLT